MVPPRPFRLVRDLRSVFEEEGHSNLQNVGQRLQPMRPSVVW